MEEAKKEQIKEVLLDLLEKAKHKRLNKIDINICPYLFALDTFGFIYSHSYLYCYGQISEAGLEALVNDEMLDKIIDHLYNVIYQKKFEQLNMDIEDESECTENDFHNLIFIPSEELHPWKKLYKICYKNHVVGLKKLMTYVCPFVFMNHWKFIPKFIKVDSKKNMLSYKRAFKQGKIIEEYFDEDYVRNNYFDENDRPIIDKIDHSFLGHGYTLTKMPDEYTTEIIWVKYPLSNNDFLIGPKYISIKK